VEQEWLAARKREAPARRAALLKFAAIAIPVVLVVSASAYFLNAQNRARVANAASERAAKEARTAAAAKTLLEAPYAAYLVALSPRQRAVRVSLNPDALAKMDEAQLIEAFTIKSTEVVVDGRIDPSLYAEAFTARISAMHNAGLSTIEYAKWGGDDNLGTDTLAKIEDNYFKPESQGLFGHEAIEEGPYLKFLTLGESIDSLIQHYGHQNLRERLYFRETVEPASIKSTKEARGTLDISFTSHFIDNWQADADFMQKSIGLQRDPSLSDGVNAWDVSGLHITGDGAVLPTGIHFN
jgi:hypothetical protein